MEQIKSKYIEYCSHLTDCTSKKLVKEHNKAMKQLSALYNITQQIDDKSFLLELLEYPDERTQVLVSSHCLGLNIYVKEAIANLNYIAVHSCNPVTSFEAQSTIEVWKQQGYLSF